VKISTSTRVKSLGSRTKWSTRRGYQGGTAGSVYTISSRLRACAKLDPPQCLATGSKIHSCYTLSNIRYPPGLACPMLNKISYANVPKEATASVTNAISQTSSSRTGDITDRHLPLATLTSIVNPCYARPGRSPGLWALEWVFSCGPLCWDNDKSG